MSQTSEVLGVERISGAFGFAAVEGCIGLYLPQEALVRICPSLASGIQRTGQLSASLRASGHAFEGEASERIFTEGLGAYARSNRALQGTFSKGVIEWMLLGVAVDGRIPVPTIREIADDVWPTSRPSLLRLVR